MYLQGIPTLVLVALLGTTLAAPLQNSWNRLKFQDSNEDKSMEDYVYGARTQYGSPSTSSSRYSLRSMEDDSREYGRGYGYYGNSPRSSQYSPLRSVEGNSREYGRYSSSSYNMPSQRQQRPSNSRYYDDDSNEVYNLAYKNLYKSLQAGRGYPSRRHGANAITVY